MNLKQMKEGFAKGVMYSRLDFERLLDLAIAQHNALHDSLGLIDSLHHEEHHADVNAILQKGERDAPQEIKN